MPKKENEKQQERLIKINTLVYLGTAAKAAAAEAAEKIERETLKIHTKEKGKQNVFNKNAQTRQGEGEGKAKSDNVAACSLLQF